ncbi:sigma-70 family RNA polymerase sigma factor [uncultured Algibacter sp.]|uniref:RNA polymerase sigma factor n=1 Tax=uncultured Algibacter sp. TaxID=298659 RepID=UPI003217B626
MDFTNHSFLLKRLATGDDNAFNYLIKEKYSKLYAYALSLTKEKNTAEDIVQTVIANFWSRRKKMDNVKKLNAYLYRAVYHEFITEFRKSSKLLYVDKKYIEALDTLIDAEEKDLEPLVEILNQEIDRLPRKCKNVFILSKRDGLTHMEISDYLGISLKTIEGHITKAFKILEAKIGKRLTTILIILFGFDNVYGNAVE